MPFAPEVQKLIEQAERLSARPVHVMEEADLKSRATVTPARGGAPAHMVRFRPGSASLDYLVASQLQFLVRTFTCPARLPVRPTGWGLATTYAAPAES